MASRLKEGVTEFLVCCCVAVLQADLTIFDDCLSLILHASHGIQDGGSRAGPSNFTFL
jgi:hypothetical protein